MRNATWSKHSRHRRQSVGPEPQRRRWTRFTEPNNGVFELRYEAAQNLLTSLTDAKGNVTQFQYYATGNLSSHVYSDGARETRGTSGVDRSGELDAHHRRSGVRNRLASRQK